VVGISDVLPAGLSVVNETLAGDITTMRPPHADVAALLLWPGEWTSFSFQARADAGLSAGPLENAGHLPRVLANTDSLTPAEPAVPRPRADLHGDGNCGA